MALRNKGVIEDSKLGGPNISRYRGKKKEPSHFLIGQGTTKTPSHKREKERENQRRKVFERGKDGAKIFLGWGGFQGGGRREGGLRKGRKGLPTPPKKNKEK